MHVSLLACLSVGWLALPLAGWLAAGWVLTGCWLAAGWAGCWLTAAWLLAAGWQGTSLEIAIANRDEIAISKSEATSDRDVAKRTRFLRFSIVYNSCPEIAISDRLRSDFDAIAFWSEI